ncbi:hypothetical protein CK203_080640 [Vitis vinifera]|uniref:Uncharacterized protein n=1 Tax=Vitis vinifera TaxID=29760 RepID=A0A438EZH1_VITVI|nr:hypothetical protein CK203_080640 [Vitis vinifera]
MVRPNTLSGRLLQVVRLNQESILVEIVRPSIWQLRGSSGTRGLNIGAICGKTSLIQSPAKIATLSQSRSFGKGEEDHSEWRRAIERRQLASERQLKALLQETERLREENAILRIQASTSGPPRRQRSRGQVANSRPEPESIYPGTAGAIPETYNKIPVVKFNARKTRPTRAWETKATAATTWAARLNPMVTPMVQNVLLHRDPMGTPMVRNVHSHLAAQQDGRNLPNEPPIGSISKRLDDMLSMPFCSHIIHYEPPRGFLVPKFSTYDGSSDPFDHIMHYRQLMTLDIGNDALLWQNIPRHPARASPFMVSSPTSQFCWQFQGLVRSFRRTILVLRSTQAKHQHSAKHKNAG